MTDKSDLEVIKAVLGGKTDEFTFIVEKYKDRIYRYACGSCGNADDADEISQDVLVAVFESLEKFRGESKFSTWLFSITINHCRNFIRKKGRMKKVSISELYDDSDYEIPDKRDSVEEKVLLNDTYNAVMNELAFLPDDYREAVMLRDVEEMSYDEIARTLSVTMSNVKIRIHRGREMLRNRLHKKGLI